MKHAVRSTLRRLFLLASLVANGCDDGATPPDDGAGANGGAGGDTATAGHDAEGGGPLGGAPPVAESCDPFQPREVAPELIVAPEGFEDAVVAFIDDAESSIDVLMYQFTRAPIAGALIAAHDRGVAVRVVLDGNQEVNDDTRADLAAAGIEVRDAPAEFEHAHAKVVIVDGDRALVASANFNSYSTSSERNYAVIDRAADDVADLQAIFAHDFDGSALDLSCTRLVVSPENARLRLLQLIGSATESLDLAVMYISDPEIRFAVKNRIAEGVAVRVLLADPDWIDGNVGTAQELAAAGAQVRFLYAYGLHAKLIVSDGVAFIGSENYSFTSLEENREVGVFVTEPGPAGEVLETFESDWADGVAP